MIAAIVCSANAQDYDDEGGSGQNDGYGDFGGGGDDDYAAPRDRGIVGAEGSDVNPGYHQGDAGNENYEGDDSAAAASQAHATISRPHLIKLIKQSKN